MLVLALKYVSVCYLNRISAFEKSGFLMFLGVFSPLLVKIGAL